MTHRCCLAWLTLVSLVSSCATIRYADSESVEVEHVASYVTCNLDGRSLTFPLYTDSKYMIPASSLPVFSRYMDAGSLNAYNDSIRLAIPDKPIVVEPEEYVKWTRLSNRLTDRRIRTNCERLFDIPGVVTAYLSDSIWVDDIKPQPDVFVHYQSPYRKAHPDFMIVDTTPRILDYDAFSDHYAYERMVSWHKDHLGLRAYRDVSKKHSIVVVTDMAYLKGGKMLFLVYPIDCRSHFITYGNNDYLSYICKGESNNRYRANCNWALMCQEIRAVCDQLTHYICMANLQSR